MGVSAADETAGASVALLHCSWYYCQTCQIPIILTISMITFNCEVNSMNVTFHQNGFFNSNIKLKKKHIKCSEFFFPF